MEIKSSEKMSIIFITHNLRIVKQISDYVCVMQNGKIIEQDLHMKFLNHKIQLYKKTFKLFT